jgi:CDP-diacylglycerol--glycerol-3-phosphate 3-phosphatidyltransferase
MPTLANLITLFRAAGGIALAFWTVSVAEALWGGTQPGLASIAAFAAFVGLAFTDALDGWVARATGTVSAAGALLDPIADKVLVLATLVAVAVAAPVPEGYVWPAVALLAVRDGAMTWARVAQGPRSTTGALKVSRLAKLKTVVEFVAVGLGLWLAVAMDAAVGFVPGIGGLYGHQAFVVLLWVATALSLWTGLAYALAWWRARRDKSGG